MTKWKTIKMKSNLTKGKNNMRYEEKAALQDGNKARIYAAKKNKEIEQINICVDDKATQIYDMSKQYEKLFNENVLLKKEIAKLKQGNKK